MVCRETLLPGMMFGGGKSQLTGKAPDAGKDRRHEEKGTTEDKMVG